MPIGRDEFTAAWPRVVRALATATRSLDLGEEYAAEAFARAAAQPPGDIGDLAGWCIRVGRRAWVDRVRHERMAARHYADLVPSRPDPAAPDHLMDDTLDDRVALLFVACDEALAPGAQQVLALRVVCGLSIRRIAAHLGIAEASAAARLTRAKATLAKARGEFAVPEAAARKARLPAVMACIAGVYTVGVREVIDPADLQEDLMRDALTLAEALTEVYPRGAEPLGLRAVTRLGLARRPGRVRHGVAVPLDEADRSRWDHLLVAAGLEDAARSMDLAERPGRFTLEAAISGLHVTEQPPDWDRLAQLYDALSEVWASPSVRVAALVVQARCCLRDATPLDLVERALEELTNDGPTYAARDAGLALADLAWRTGRRADAALRYRDLAEVMPAGPLRAFCVSRTIGLVNRSHPQ